MAPENGAAFAGSGGLALAALNSAMTCMCGQALVLHDEHKITEPVKGSACRHVQMRMHMQVQMQMRMHTQAQM